MRIQKQVVHDHARGPRPAGGVCACGALRLLYILISRARAAPRIADERRKYPRLIGMRDDTPVSSRDSYSAGITATASTSRR